MACESTFGRVVLYIFLVREGIESKKQAFFLASSVERTTVQLLLIRQAQIRYLLFLLRHGTYPITATL